jgi:hypothetical protein
MGDLILSYIRTYVPIAVGGVLSWLAVTFGVVVPEDASGALTVALTGILIAVYYGVVRALESRWPWVGRLLGAARTVSYERPADAAVTALRERRTYQ